MAKHGIDSRLFLALLVCVGSASAQGIPPPEPVRRAVSDGSTAPAVFEGFVLEPGGGPAEGAVVASSAGGRAVTDVAGSYRLEVDVPREATSVRLTAVGSAGGNLVASSNVALSGTSSATRVDPLMLSPGSSCTPSWLPTFASPGANDRVNALTTFDDGNRTDVYAGGIFTAVDGVPANLVARWDGSEWSALPGLTGSVHALAVFDDGNGPALHAGGELRFGGIVLAQGIAKWDGSDWTVPGSGVGPRVTDLLVHDDGTGPALYAAFGTYSFKGVRKWDGSSWQDLGSGMFGDVLALEVYDDGGGAALYAGGSFTTAGGVAANHIAKWDGSSWSEVGGGVDGPILTRVQALTVFDDGGGPALIAAGRFNTAGGLGANNIAKWNGTSWLPLGHGAHLPVDSLTVHDDGSGPALYASGLFDVGGSQFRVARWNGLGWSGIPVPFPNGGPDRVFALTTYDDGSGSVLCAGGQFELEGANQASGIAKWDGSSWSALGRGVDNRLNDRVGALAVGDEAGGHVLYAGGRFTTAGGLIANRIAKWDGSSWSPLGSGMDLFSVFALAMFDDGGGPALHAGGDFLHAGGVAANRIAKWDGASWSALSSGLSNSVRSLTVYDDSTGPALYAGGDFTTAGGVAANRIARWDGASWSALASGLGRSVRSLSVYDDGTGPALYAGGFFTSAGGVAANLIAKWDGSAWSALGSGMSGHGPSGTDPSVNALAVYDDGSGPALFAGGGFQAAGGMPANNIAKWDGSTWQALGSGTNTSVDSLAVYDDGTGPALYAGGRFFTAGGVVATGIARWDGSSWSPLGSGTNPGVDSLAVYDDGHGPALFAGGQFFNAIDSGDRYIAKWGCPVVAEQCVQGPGHWRTHACDWPAPFVPGTPDPTDADGDGVPDDVEGQCGVRGNAPDSQCPCDALHTITIGSIAYDQCELLCGLGQPVQGNALRLLGRQLIAAKLNVLNGASDDGVVQASCAGLPPNPYDGYTVAELIAAADDLIATGTTDGSNTFACASTANCPCPAFPANILTDCVPTSAAQGNTLGPAMTVVAQLLELYSEGCGGVPRCIPAQFFQDEPRLRTR